MINISKKAMVMLILFLLVSSAGLALLAHAAQNSGVTTVEGLIVRVSDDSIYVRDKWYELSGVPLVKSTGEPAKWDELHIGKKVEIFFKDERITNVLIYQGAPE